MSQSPTLPEIDVHQLKSRLEEVTPFVLLDVREHTEIAVCCLPGSVVIPLGELPTRLAELDAASETIIHCKAGGRSAKALQILLDAGFEDVCHVKGGINAWSAEIDPTVPHY
jgi:adenylyltransferase/sulfurtransferase